MRYCNAEVFVNGAFVRGGIDFDELINAVGPAVTGGTDARGSYIIPGLVDIHTHGALGADAADAESAGLTKMSRWYAARGVTSWCPTIVSLPGEATERAAAVIGAFVPDGGAKVAGIHMEGPFLSREKRGAHEGSCLIPPDLSLFERVNAASGGIVRLITLAPELPGAAAFIAAVKDRCTVSLGHTAADYDTAMAAFDAGASHVTHLYNGMPPLHHRAPSLIAAAADSGASAELIADGVHVHPAAVRLAFRIFGKKTVLVSDSLRCAGMPEGEYGLGGRAVEVKNGAAYVMGTDTLAGSCVSLTEALRRCVAFGVPAEAAVYAATAAPAAVIDRTGIGALAPGRWADLVVADAQFNVLETYVNGAVVG